MKIFSIISQVGFGKFTAAVFGEIYRKVVREKIQGSFAQDYEDLMIEKLVSKRKGFYLEIGGYHPTRLSNTYRFYKKGWRGVVVEPNPEVKKLFERYRPGDKFINMGIGIKTDTLDYFKYAIPALNTFDKNQVEENKRKGFEVNEKIGVKIVEIGSFLKKSIQTEIDLLSLDVEGWDEKILKNWDWKYKPKVICVETDQPKNRVDILLKEKGYDLINKTRHNSIFTRKN